jgi:F-type H+-transporting ATPase subunit epsilon
MAVGASLTIEIVSPERVLYSGEANQVITRTAGGGEIAFLAGHAPFLGSLVENHTRVYLVDGSVQDIAVHGGFVQVNGSTVTILSDNAELAAEIDITRAQRARERAEETLRHGHDAEAEAALRRAQARLTAAGHTGITAH